MKEYLIWMAAGITAVFVLLLGLDVLSKRPRSKFLVAVSACLFWLSGITGLGTNPTLSQDKPKAEEKDKGQEEIEKRIEEIKKTKEWRKLRKIYEKLIQIEKRVNEAKGLKGPKWREKVREELTQIEKRLEIPAEARKGTDGHTFPLPKEEAIRQITFMLEIFAEDIAYQAATKAGRMCYEMAAPLECRKSKVEVEKRRKLLEQSYKEGKIKQDVYEKTRKAFDLLEIDWEGCDLRKLSNKNFAFLCKLMVEFCKPEEVTKISPEIAKRIDELIEKLGDDKFEVREDAHQKLLEIGEVAIPALKKATEHKDPEVVWRAKAILEELEW